MAVAGMGLGIVSLVFAVLPIGLWIIGLFAGIVGCVLSGLVYRNCKLSGQPAGVATAGLVMSIIGVALSLLIIISCSICFGAPICSMCALAEELF